MTAKPLNVALFPQQITWGDKAANIDTLIDICEKVHPQTDLLILPETFSTGFPSGTDKETVRAMSERNTGKTIDTIKALSAKYGFAIAGSFIADTGGLLYNRAFFIEPNGEETFADKRHLFSMAGENKIFSPGTERLKVRYRGWNLAMIVCYDIRFPVWCRNSQCEYDALIAIANWPTTRVGAWEALLKARAIENLAYVLGVDCKGTDTHGFEYNGSTAVIDFKGKDIGINDSNTSLIYSVLDYERLAKFRTKFPAWEDADTFTLR
ncbi:MAG: nitrilase family protein [Prevotella sp.]|nr:nitrilase family protein [Prevotella sp.]MCM1074699.1 hypothetical protein [Ruminococcus sp.]